jgi:3-isopropylmalate dehydrogenase
VRVLTRVGEVFGHSFEFIDTLIGGAALRAGEAALPASTVAAAKGADAVLLGAVGHPDFDHLPSKSAPGIRVAGAASRPGRLLRIFVPRARGSDSRMPAP